MLSVPTCGPLPSLVVVYRTVAVVVSSILGCLRLLCEWEKRENSWKRENVAREAKAREEKRGRRVVLQQGDEKNRRKGVSNDE